MRLFLIDDEEGIRIGIGDDLRDMGHEVFDFEKPKDAVEQFLMRRPDVVLCDLKMPQMDGFEVLSAIRKLDPLALVVMITAHGNIESAVRCLKAGGFDFLTKPFTAQDVKTVLDNASGFVELKVTNRKLREESHGRRRFGQMLGQSKSMQRVFDQIESYAKTDSVVLIQGATGTGKELVTNAIHYNSNRSDGPFIKMSCSIFTSSLIESELFGHEKGSFTGAIRQKKGRIELAEGGTLFLDEVDDLSMEVQVKLLRFLQEKTFERVGGEETLSANVRVVAATKVDLPTLVKEGRFREDLYYRLNVLPIHVPPLRLRKDDIPLLIHHFYRIHAPGKEMNLSPEALEKILTYSWPGNVRQLEHVSERLALTLGEQRILPEHLPGELMLTENLKGESINPSFPKPGGEISLEEALEQIEILWLQQALDEAKGNKKQASRSLNIPYSTLRNKLEKYGLNGF